MSFGLPKMSHAKILLHCSLFKMVTKIMWFHFQNVMWFYFILQWLILQRFDLYALMEVCISNDSSHFTFLSYIDIFHTLTSSQRKTISVKNRSVFMERWNKCPFKSYSDRCLFSSVECALSSAPCRCDSSFHACSVLWIGDQQWSSKGSEDPLELV